MADKKYTKAEVTAMADRCYHECDVFCDRYEPIHCWGGGTDKLFEWSNSGCYYSAELPWGSKRWCWFFGPKKTAKNETGVLKSLTWADLVDSAKGKSR